MNRLRFLRLRVAAFLRGLLGNEDFRRAALFVLAMAAVAVGFWWAWPPLGLIVPGLIVLALLVFSHLVPERGPDA